jgi:hypothetical protein
MILRSVMAITALAGGLLLAAPVVSIALVLAVTGATVRRIAAVIGDRRESVHWRGLVDYEPVVGWRPRPNLDVFATADDVFRLTTDSDGWRGRGSVAQADIVVFGDSYAFGHGADDRDMYTEFAGHLRVKPIGSDGYDMVHGLLWMKRLASELRGKLVVWFVYYGNDLHENLMPSTGHYRMPYVRPGAAGDGWKIVTDHVSPEPWPFPPPSSYHRIMAKFSCANAFSRRVFSACEFLISESSKVCTEAGATLAVVGIPDRVQLTARGKEKLRRLAPTPEDFDVEKPDRELARITERLGIPFVSLREHLSARDYLIHDIHWRRSGNRKVGQVLRRLHEREHRASVIARTLAAQPGERVGSAVEAGHVAEGGA